MRSGPFLKSAFLNLFVLVKLSCLPRFLFDLKCVTDVFIGVRLILE